MCVNSPVTQEYLREMMRKLVREYPDVKGVQLYNLDVGAWFCTPNLCERCKRACTDSPGDVFNPWETQAKLVSLLADAAHEENPGFDFRFWATVHYHGELFDKLVHAVKGYNGLMSAWTGSDRSVMVPDAAERTATCLMTQEVCRNQGAPFFMMCEFNNLEVIPRSLPFPFHVCDALAKYKRWDVKNLTEIFGVAPEHSSINALVTKEFEWNPDQSVEAFLVDLSVRQFGKPAGELVYQSWKEVEKTFDVWNDVQGPPFPLMGSQFHVKMGTAIGNLPPSIVPKMAQTYDDTINILTRVEPWLAEGYQQNRTKAFLEKMELVDVHLRQAADCAKRAIGVASGEEFIGLCSYEGENGRPSCKEYAELNYAPIAIMESLCRQRCNILRACHLLSEIENARTTGDDALVQEKEKAYRALIQEDIGVQERFCELLTGFSQMQPCYTRTSLKEQEIADFLSLTRGKIAELKDYLATASSG